MAKEKLADIIDMEERRHVYAELRAEQAAEETAGTCEVLPNYETERVELGYSTYIQAASMDIEEARTLAMKILSAVDDILGYREGGL